MNAAKEDADILECLVDKVSGCSREWLISVLGICCAPLAGSEYAAEIERSTFAHTVFSVIYKSWKR